MDGQVQPKMLQKKWIHAHEEDTPTHAVFRPASFPLPAARGRDGFELGPEQALTHLGIGRGDARSETRGKWELKKGDRPTLVFRMNDGEERQFAIISLENDRLVVQK